MLPACFQFRLGMHSALGREGCGGGLLRGSVLDALEEQHVAVLPCFHAVLTALLKGLHRLVTRCAVLVREVRAFPVVAAVGVFAIRLHVLLGIVDAGGEHRDGGQESESHLYSFGGLPRKPSAKRFLLRQDRQRGTRRRGGVWMLDAGWPSRCASCLSRYCCA